MRFLILTQYFPPEIGGAATRLKCFATELVRQGHEVEVVTSLPNYPRGNFFAGYENALYKKEVLDSLTVHRVWLYPVVGGGFKRMLNYTSFSLACLYGLLRAARPDYLFVESPPIFLSIPAFLMGTFWRTPFIFNVADLWPDVIVDGGFMKEGWIIRCLRGVERWSYRRATHVNAVTDSMFRTLRVGKSVPEEKLLFLPNGVDTRKFRPSPPDEDLKHKLGLTNKRILLWAGTLGYAHGLDKVLEAAKLLEANKEIHFLFVGDGSARGALVRLNQELRLTNVTFHDPVSLEEIPAYYSIAFCGLSSLIDIPLFEGARPSKLFPILASGKPLIFVGRGESARLIESAQAGFAVPPGDPKLLAEAISRLAGNPMLCAALGENGRRFAEDHLDWSLLVSNWLRHLTRGQARQSSMAAEIPRLSC